MAKTVSEAHPQLYHYTTAAGLQGIVESQQLRATNIAYLNDSEEHTGFFDRRLPGLLEAAVRAAAEGIQDVPAERNRFEANGGIQAALQALREFGDAVKSATLKFNNPYVASFCTAMPQQDPDDGLLSQWRGYGPDGGYAIVFDTHGLEKLLETESKNSHYQYLFWGDVDYYDQDSTSKASQPESVEAETKVRGVIRKILRSGVGESGEMFEPLFDPITKLSCSHKHRGFREEAEVRIVAIPSHGEFLSVAQESGDRRPIKPIHFVMKNGVLVPYIMLFNPEANENLAPLPIVRVIVGPHPDKFKRQKAVQLMLEQHDVDASVTASDIPCWCDRVTCWVGGRWRSSRTRRSWRDSPRKRQT